MPKQNLDFLDDFGESKEGFVPRETLGVLDRLVGEFIESCQTNLENSKSNASGELSSSIVAEDPQTIGSTISVDVTMLFYGQFINKGVKGTKSGSGLYSFKSDMPSRKMVAALVNGIGRAKKSTRNVNRSKTTYANEKKNINISDIKKAWGAARNIKMYGIKATGFLDKAIATTERKAENELGSAFQIDIYNSLPDKI